TLPDGFFMPARHGTDRLPLGLEPLDLGRGPHPVGGIGQRLDALAELLFAGKIPGALFALRRKVRLAAREDLVLRSLEPSPERLALRARGLGHLLPSRLELAHLSRGLVDVLLRLQAFHLAAQLFLHLKVGPALPVVGVAQLLDARRQLDTRLLETRHDLLAIFLGRQRDALLDRGTNLAECA